MTWPSLLASRWFVWLVLPLLWAAAYLPNLGARDLRLEEGRRAGPAREMMAAGQYVLPTIYGEPYLSKPPLFFWVVAASAAVCGGMTEFAARLPSVLSVLAGAWVLWALPAGQMSRTARGLAALLLISGPILLDKGTLGEIESFFCLIVIALLAAWWRGYDEQTGPTPAAWLWSGVILGLAVLVKGPPALVLFYGPVVAFLVWRRQASALLSPWHAAGFVLAVLPAAVWVWRLQESGIDITDTANWWKRQMIGARPGSQIARYVGHLLQYPFEILLMVLPWGLHAALLFRRPAAAEPGRALPEPLRRFLVAAIPAIFVFFWLWPNARPRHMMVVWWPACLLAGAALAGAWAWPTGPKWAGLFRVTAGVAGYVASAAGFGGLIAAQLFHPDAVFTTALGAGFCGVLGFVSLTLTIRTADRDLPVAAAGAVAVAILAVWMQVALVFLPWKGERDPRRAVWLAAREHIPEERPLYTRFLFPDTAFYNHQFYFGPRLRALPPGGYHGFPLNRPATVLMSVYELAELEKRPDFRTRLLIDIPVEDVKLDGEVEHIAVVEVSRLR
jgi:4-amino-4-deoxy-L-arabinose transferase-like glycosyltransferase